jgi:hypothetical protein
MKIANVVIIACAMGAPTLLPLTAKDERPVEIRVRLINARTGKPIPGKPVRIDSADPSGLWRGYLEEKTGRDGVAIFRLTPPLPRKVDIFLGMGGYWAGCSRGDYSVEEILKKGAIWEVEHCLNLPRIQDRFNPRPGEVFYFAVHETLWEHLKYGGAD